MSIPITRDWFFYRDLIGKNIFIRGGFPNYYIGNNEYYFYFDNEIYNIDIDSTFDSMWILSKEEMIRHAKYLVPRHIKLKPEEHNKESQYILDIIEMETIL